MTHIDELGRLRITEESNRSVIELLRGVMSFFHRDAPEDVEVRGAGTSAIIRGTEFAVTVDAGERMELVLYDGSVEMTNAAGRILARTGDVIQADAHSAPTRSPALAGTNRTAIQWVLHYPAVLDPADVRLSPEEAVRWEPALALYRSGALLPALGSARALGEPSSDATRLLRAALHLGAGDVPGFEQYVERIDPASPLVPLRDALRTVLHAVRFEADSTSGRIRPRLSTTELLAESYRLQSLGQLDEARELARDAVKEAPGFGFANARPDYRFRETQNPILLGGYHHEWSPGSHTLFLGGRLVNRQQLDDRNAGQLVAFQFPDADPASAPMDLRHRNDFETYTGELNHILQSERHTTVVGGRYQAGEFNATAALDTTPSQAPGVFEPIVVTEGNGDLERRSLYAYHTWEILPGLRLTGGVSYDDLTAPRNFRRPPLQSGERDSTRWSPKAALVYSPSSTFALRGLYAESLGGVSYDESIRLEPTQLAGFPQAFRTLISESLVGSVETPRHRSSGLGIDLRLPTRTYLSVEGTWLESRIDQDLGFFAFDALRPLPGPPALPASAIQLHRYRERSARLIANQILAEEWFVQGLYQFTRSELDSTLPDLPAPAGHARSRADAADLHAVKASLLHQRTDGWFSRLTTALYRQDNSGISGAADEDFAHLSVFVGYRFPRHLGELTVGVLNLTDRNYGLSPLTPYDELPRERMIYLRLRLQL